MLETEVYKQTTLKRIEKSECVTLIVSYISQYRYNLIKIFPTDLSWTEILTRCHSYKLGTFIGMLILA